MYITDHIWQLQVYNTLPWSHFPVPALVEWDVCCSYLSLQQELHQICLKFTIQQQSVQNVRKLSSRMRAR